MVKKMKSFKIHVVRHGDEETATSFCGINSDNCSEDFWDKSKFVPLYDYTESDCKSCRKSVSIAYSRFSEKAL